MVELLDHKPEMWLLNGGVATIESYADYSDEEIDKHLEFFSQMYNYLY